MKRNGIFMSNVKRLSEGSVKKTLLMFAGPYLLAAFMQTFYGIVDMYVVGLFCDKNITTAVAVGSQVIHMLTVIILGLVMGATVCISQAIGENDETKATDVMRTSVLFFAVVAVVLTVALFFLTGPIATLLRTPLGAKPDAITYLRICFLGIPFIMAYNVISGIFRGVGDSKHPMYFVGIACVVNIILDFILIGGLKMSAAGAALGTVIGQAVSSLAALIYLRIHPFTKNNDDATMQKANGRAVKWLDAGILGNILSVGLPVALQDGLIQVAFLVITVIANERGVVDAAGVGITEKLIGFYFLVPSAFLSAISAITAQNVGAGKPERARESLGFGLAITVGYGALIGMANMLVPELFVGLLSKDADVVSAGCSYMRAYGWDTMLAAIHFCFSGYFCGIQKSGISFFHNIMSIILLRIPGAYVASKMFTNTLLPMGAAAPAGSLLSDLICLVFYLLIRNKQRQNEDTRN